MKSFVCFAPQPPTHVSWGVTVASWFDVLVYGLCGPCSSPGWGHCIVLLGRTLDSYSASPLVYDAGQNEIQVKMKFLCLLTLIIHG